ncbi:glycosyltransferase [Lacibacter luteus]|uniref:Glycosyltransferase n=1 Tax=Lacibacter luteus TaxID=2508719 RepID=A0A4Q1CDQ1_9BACT|nr:glycosyltransferase family 2 protein [Lacibacter luteus]RXK57429.1 glycosyltransferase [Lacibacter luteus]
MSAITLSIITVNYNNREGLAKTIASVGGQLYKDYEYIVIDGGSTDGSRELLEENKHLIGYAVSEKDCGIYHAMNKGIARARGTYIQFLNAGDVYNSKDSLQVFFKANPVAEIVYADYTDAATGELYRMPETLSFRFFYRQSLNHQATLIQRSLFERFELYNENSPIIADWEFFIRSIVLHSASTQYIAQPFIRFDFGDSMSNNPANLDKINRRRTEVLQQHFPLLVKDMEYIDAIEQSTTFKLLRRITKLKSFFSK